MESPKQGADNDDNKMGAAIGVTSAMVELKIDVNSESFELEKAVCNHGFFMTAPNQWNPSSKSFQRPLRLADGLSSLTVSIAQEQSDHILVRVHGVDSLSFLDEKAILEQVVRMLRISDKDENDVREFQRMHDQAKDRGFGRLFRSPDLFEDIIKSTLLTNVTWLRTLKMSRALCELQARLQAGDTIPPIESKPSGIINFRKTKSFGSKRKHSDGSIVKGDDTQEVKNVLPNFKDDDQPKPLGNFPSSKELAGLSEDYLERSCSVGYRAQLIIQLARMVESGELKLKECEGNQAVEGKFYEKLYKKLMKVKGIGDFTAANISLCLGVYKKIPADTETVAHLQKVHAIKSCTKYTVRKHAREVYDQFAPYQCLAYWYELVESYERKQGQRLSELSPMSYYTINHSFGRNSDLHHVRDQDEGKEETCDGEEKEMLPADVGKADIDTNKRKRNKGHGAVMARRRKAGKS